MLSLSYRAVVGQDFFLFSWTLVGAQLTVLILNFGVSVFLLLAGSHLNTVNVVSTIFMYVHVYSHILIVEEAAAWRLMIFACIQRPQAFASLHSPAR
jgi:hypothetical protein